MHGLFVECFLVWFLQARNGRRSAFRSGTTYTRTTSRWRTTKYTTGWDWKCTTTNAKTNDMAIANATAIANNLPILKKQKQNQFRKNQFRLDSIGLDWIRLDSSQAWPGMHLNEMNPQRCTHGAASASRPDPIPPPKKKGIGMAFVFFKRKQTSPSSWRRCPTARSSNCLNW